MGEGQACMCECTLLLEARDPSGAEARVGCEEPENLGPLEEHCVLFTAEPPSGLFMCVCSNFFLSNVLTDFLLLQRGHENSDFSPTS